jgi:filamentous hemagglutinin
MATNTPEVTTKIAPKIGKQMGKRGWTPDLIDETIQNPARKVSTTDTRWKPDGTKMNDPATAYIDKNGNYVVRNNETGDIVQVSDRNDPNWKSPF